MGVRRLVLVAAFFLPACQTMTPDRLAPFVEVVMPKGWTANDGKVPAVLFLQGTGGANIRSELWTGWFNSIGVAGVIIDNAGARGRSDLSGVPYQSQAEDVSGALRLLQADERIDWKRYGIMGFSRGGNAVLHAGAVLAKDQPAPAYVFSLYPGINGGCPAYTYTEPTRTLIFYGELDEWGSFNNNRDGCRSMSERTPNVDFHLIKNAHHGFDDLTTARWT